MSTSTTPVRLPLRTFLCHMFKLLCTVRRDDHSFRLNQEFQQDLTWWHELFQSLDALSFFQMSQWVPLPDFQVLSNALCSLGHGAIFSTQCFFGTYSASQKPPSIDYKELLPIAVAAHLWGSQWMPQLVEFLCNNMSVVAVLSSGMSREGGSMIIWLCYLYTIHFLSRHPQSMVKLTQLGTLFLAFSFSNSGS